MVLGIQTKLPFIDSPEAYQKLVIGHHTNFAHHKCITISHLLEPCMVPFPVTNR